jgi:magnesium chelatase subunit D
VKEPSARAEIVKMRLAFEADPDGFAERWESDEKELSSRVAPAQALLDRVRCPEDMLEFVAKVALDMGVHGHRADISMVKTARTIAAFGGRDEVTKEDIREAAELVLPHRMRRSPFEEPSVQEERLDEAFEKHSEQKEAPPDPFDEIDRGDRSDSAPPVGLQTAPQQDFVFGVGNPYHVGNIAPRGRTSGGARGRRGKAVGDSRAGRYVRSAVPRGEDAFADIALDATLRAAAPHQLGRRSEGKAFVIEKSDLRQKVRERRVGSTVVFVVDSSGSMGARQRMVATKGAILSLLVDAYQRRDKVAMVAFKGDHAEVLLPPTASVELAKRKLEELPTGGKTPFSRGLCLGYEVLAAELLKDKNVDPLLVLVSDGRANVALAPGRDAAGEVQEIAEKLKASGIRSVAIDTESGPVRFGNMARFAEALGAVYSRMEDIKSDRITDVVRSSLVR